MGVEDEDGIYSSVEVAHSVGEDQIQMVRALFERSPGTWFHANRIGSLCGISSKDTAVRVRNIITVLLDRGVPIVATSAGFCYTLQPEMIARYAENLTTRLAGLQRRIESVRRIHMGMVR